MYMYKIYFSNKQANWINPSAVM